MSLLAALKKHWHYSVESPGEGRLVYREGNREYTFPMYEEDGILVLVGIPSAQRIHFFFNWYWHPREFPDVVGARILPRIEEYLRSQHGEVRVLTRGGKNEGEFEFHPELFEQRSRASELLDEAGFTWFSNYASIDLVHEEYGLEISGIVNSRDVKPILNVLKRGFPHWHHSGICHQEQGREPGWTVSICMFPAHGCGPCGQEES